MSFNPLSFMFIRKKLLRKNAAGAIAIASKTKKAGNDNFVQEKATIDTTFVANPVHKFQTNAQLLLPARAMDDFKASGGQSLLEYKGGYKPLPQLGAAPTERLD